MLLATTSILTKFKPNFTVEARFHFNTFSGEMPLCVGFEKQTIKLLSSDCGDFEDEPGTCSSGCLFERYESFDNAIKGPKKDFFLICNINITKIHKTF